MTELSLSARLTALANPKRFLDLSAVLLPWTGGLAALFLGVGLYMSLFATPPDYQQGETVKIMFVHVPAAWMGMFVYAAISASGCLNTNPMKDAPAIAA